MPRPSESRNSGQIADALFAKLKKIEKFIKERGNNVADFSTLDFLKIREMIKGIKSEIGKYDKSIESDMKLRIEFEDCMSNDNENENDDFNIVS